MEIVPFNTAAPQDRIVSLATQPASRRAQWPQWREALPTLIYRTTRLRELRASDAVPLMSMLTTEEVTRFISPPPVSQEGFERFIQWSHSKRVAGEYVCFGVVPRGYDVAVGIFQVQLTDSTPEWGFAIGSPFW